ncbi:hypothetical protein G6O67_006456 [Ophiocordyceps sinensis]|uniref:Protein kinase domain-containing protein n=2 Tax=Ophiocordyceps sinensis TaxID=72228 RepID=A0A8H4PMS4_9HYPO|nr:Protein kinase-like domain protein [Ophiocordyceps sinensis CO18]KAF4506366.1 hypothetical protein G6O67_006456 [Ophiocordyceps sinensis]
MDTQYPQHVTEPEDIGYGVGDIKILDFGYAFRPKDGAAYGRDVFAPGTPCTPEFIGTNKKTTRPFKAESWYQGQLIRFVLVDGWPLFRQYLLLFNDEELQEH